MKRKMAEEKKSLLSRTWKFLWEEDSAASWVANVVLAFILIKFIVYPGLGLLLSTTHPIVAVVSGSMEHDGNFEDWWNRDCQGIPQKDLYSPYEITKSDFQSFKFKNGFDKGDIMILKGASDPKIGDVLVYWIDTQPDPIIHRVVAVDSKDGHNVYKTKGDHNCGLNGFEEQIESDQIVGQAVLRVPWLGWVKLIFMNIVSYMVGAVSG